MSSTVTMQTSDPELYLKLVELQVSDKICELRLGNFSMAARVDAVQRHEGPVTTSMLPYSATLTVHVVRPQQIRRF